MTDNATATRITANREAKARVWKAVNSLHDYLKEHGCVHQDLIDELQQAASNQTRLLMGR